MPLVICRACKSYAGKAINYVTEKNKAERITTHGLDESRSFAQQFIDTAALHGKGDSYDERKYYHIKISFEPKDRIENGGKLTAEFAEKIADEYFKKQYGNHEYILATHTDKKHIHCHAIINAVNFENGKKIQHSNKDLADMKDHVNDVAEQYGVSRFDWKEAVKLKRQKAKEERASSAKELTQAEKYIQERHGAEWTSSSWKETLRDKIDEAKGQCTSRTEFEKYLSENYGIEMPRNTNKTVSFKHPAVDETVRGVKLGAEYTAESIDRALNENYERSITNARLRITEELHRIFTVWQGNTHTLQGKNPRKRQQKRRFRNLFEERADRDVGTAHAGADAGANNKINIGDNISANDAIGSGADESGERGTQTSVSELREKLQQIRGLDAQFNPAEQRRATEAAERAAQQARAEAERNEDEQRGSKQNNRRRSQGHDI